MSFRGIPHFSARFLFYLNLFHFIYTPSPIFLYLYLYFFYLTFFLTLLLVENGKQKLNNKNKKKNGKKRSKVGEKVLFRFLGRFWPGREAVSGPPTFWPKKLELPKHFFALPFIFLLFCWPISGNSVLCTKLFYFFVFFFHTTLSGILLRFFAIFVSHL